jgi:arginyl-tRNA synthetase
LEGGFGAPATFLLEAPEERVLAAKLLQFGEVVPLVLDGFRPNLLANYLYDLAIIFHAFYEVCPVLKAEGAERRDSRLILCDITARSLGTGLGLLGIDSPERM